MRLLRHLGTRERDMHVSYVCEVCRIGGVSVGSVRLEEVNNEVGCGWV